MATASDHLKALNGFLAKADGKDKLTALIQYAAMWASAGAPGNARKVQASVAAGRKIFRVFRPLESVTPVLLDPHFVRGVPMHKQAIAKLKAVLMAVYFAADHVVWAGQAGLTTDAKKVGRWQKVSLWAWFGGSVCTLLQECEEIGVLAATKRPGEAVPAWRARQAKAAAEIDRRILVLVHAGLQALLAIGLLGLRPWKPRTVGAIGVAASALNCYFLYPAVARVGAGAGAGAPAPAPSSLSAPVVAATEAAVAARRAAEAAAGLVPKELSLKAA